jgi:S1-C subfamily serine protease
MVGGRPVNNLREFALSLFRFKIGDPASLEILRGAQKLSVSVPVIERAGDPQRFADMVNEQDNLVSKLGMMGLTVSEQLRKLLPELRIPSGVVVAARTGNSDYWGDDLKQGDVIHTVNSKAITDVASLRAAISAIPSSTPVILQIEREGILSYLVLETD